MVRLQLIPMTLVRTHGGGEPRSPPGGDGGSIGRSGEPLPDMTHEPPPTRRGRTRTTQGHRRMAPWRVGLPPTPLVGQHTIRLDRASATAFARSGPLRLGSADLGPLTGHPFEGDTVVCTAGPPEYTYCVLFNNPSPRGCSRRRATRTIVHVNVLITHASDAPKHRETEARIPTSQTQFPNLPNTG